MAPRLANQTMGLPSKSTTSWDAYRRKMRAGLDLLPTWALEQKAAANRQVVAVMRGRLKRREPVVPMYGPLGLAWLQRQADIAEQLIRARGQPSQ